MSYLIDPSELKKAAERAHTAAEHFHKTTTGLERAASELDDGPFRGGHGETGWYQGRLETFQRELSNQFALFVKDERKFVAFLDGLHTRIEKAAGIYHRNEEHHAQSFNQISRALDEPGG